MFSYILLAHVWERAGPKDVALPFITSTRRAVCVPGHGLSRHVRRTFLEGYVLIPDLTCPVFEDVSLV